MKVKAIQSFYDKKEKKDRAVGEVFEATKARAEEINEAGYGQLVDILASPKKAAPKTEE